MNPRALRDDATFPCVREPIRSIPHQEGDPDSRTKSRTKWEAAAKAMRPEAVAIVRRVQPTVDCRPYFHCLELLNRPSNKNRHRDLLINVNGLTGISVRFVMHDGTTYGVDPEPDDPEGQPGTAALPNGATITVPPELDPNQFERIDVQGLTTQAIPMGGLSEPGVVAPDMFRQILDWIRHEVVMPVSPYVVGP